MWTLKVINWVTNLFGSVGGVAELIEAIQYFQQEDIAHGILKLLEGATLFVTGYFTGKSALSLKPH